MAAKKVPLDETDRIILRKLIDDPQATIADIARAVGVQRDTVKYRIERFEKRGLILKYQPIIDPAALGCEVFMQVMIKTKPASNEQSAAFVATLKAHKNVTHIERLIGKYDYALQMAASDISTFDEALGEVKEAGAGVIAEIELANIIDGAKLNDFSGLV